MKEPEMRTIGTWIADILGDVTNTELQTKVRAEAAELAGRFLVP
jgi:glycine/serine hydroxymethyltransferase